MNRTECIDRLRSLNIEHDDILKPGDVPAGAEVDSYYSRGIAVYK